MKEVNYNKYGEEALAALEKGVFLNVADKDEDNTMTIGWGTIGYIWRKPVFMVMVRYSRYTYEMLNKSGEFTVSIPFGDQFKKELGICGTKSGRDIDKFQTCNLSRVKAHKVNAPLISGCDLHYECRVVYSHVLEPADLEADLSNKFYNNNDLHVLFYGEIIGTYLEER